MDDNLCGAETLEEAKELKEQFVGILEKVGMPLLKNFVNHTELSNS